MYTTRQVADLVNLPASQVRRYARSGCLTATRDHTGHYRYDFHDLVVLRTASRLWAESIPHDRVRRVLRSLRAQVSAERPVTEVRLAVIGDRLVAGDGDGVWDPESGQSHFDFSLSKRASKVAPLPSPAETARTGARRPRHAEAADYWFRKAREAETTNTFAAIHAYREAVVRDPHLVEARINLGRLVHEAGNAREAASHYRAALEVEPNHAIAAFNLAVALEDDEQPADAIAWYTHAVEADPQLADAHYNLASLYERLGQPHAALRHLTTYRRLARATPG